MHLLARLLTDAQLGVRAVTLLLFESVRGLRLHRLLPMPAIKNAIGLPPRTPDEVVAWAVEEHQEEYLRIIAKTWGSRGSRISPRFARMSHNQFADEGYRVRLRDFYAEDRFAYTSEDATVSCGGNLPLHVRLDVADRDAWVFRLSMLRILLRALIDMLFESAFDDEIRRRLRKTLNAFFPRPLISYMLQVDIQLEREGLACDRECQLNSMKLAQIAALFPDEPIPACRCRGCAENSDDDY